MRCYHWAAAAACLVLMTWGCHEEPIGTTFADDNYSPQGALVIPSNVQVGFFDLADPDNAGIAFDLTTKGEAVSSADVIATHSGGASATIATVTSFPSTVNVPLNDLLSSLGLTVDDVEVGDNVIFTFTGSTSTGVYNSSRTVSAPFSCKSTLSGTLDYVSTNYFCSGADLTGQVMMTSPSAGKYTFSDWSFGTYPECYGGSAANWGSLQLNDVCNQITVTGVDNYGDSWDFIINSVNGADLNASWSNTYGEFGTVTLTRTDGKNWPALTN